MTVFYTYQKPCQLLILVLFFLASCQTPRESSLSAQRIKMEWSTMAEAAASGFRHAGIKLTAELKWQDAEWGKEYYFDNFSLTDDPNKYRIDLLAPKFEGKFICSWRCEPLTVRQYDKLVGHYTYLNFFYQSVKPELLNFYSNLLELEEDMHHLNVSKQHFAVNLFQLTHNMPQLNTLDQVQAYLASNLFLQRSYFAEQNEEKPNSLQSLVDDPSGSFDDTVTISNIEKDSFSGQIPSPHPYGLVKNSLNVGDWACTHNENYFGEIAEIDPTSPQVLLLVRGQAKTMHDDQIVELPAGSLAAHDSAQQYLEFNDMKVIQLNDLFLCQVSL